MPFPESTHWLTGCARAGGLRLSLVLVPSEEPEAAAMAQAFQDLDAFCHAHPLLAGIYVTVPIDTART